MWIADRTNDRLIEWDIAGAAVTQYVACVRFPIDVLAVNGLVFVAGTNDLGIYDAASGVELLRMAMGMPASFRQGLVDTGSHIVACDYLAKILYFFDRTTGEIVTQQSVDDAFGIAGFGNGYIFVSRVAASKSTVGLTLASSMSGYTATVYQVSASVGRGYPASVTL